MPGKLVAIALLLAGLWDSSSALAADLPPGATVLDSDIVWDVANPHSFAISRDGKQIAYMSKGALWACRVDGGPPTKLSELPNTITAILAEPANLEQREKSAAAPHNLRHQDFFGPMYANRDYVYSLAWMPNQNDVVYTVRKRVRDDSPVFAYHVMHAPFTGTVSEIAVFEGHFGAPQEYQSSLHVAPDHKFVVASAYNTPLIWDVLTEKPRATPYDLLTPSSTSGRFLGIEIDTRQLVLIDEHFRIVNRFDATFPAKRAVDLIWSEDERFAICRTRDDYSTRANNPYNATAFRIDLEKGRQTPLGKCNLRDQFVSVGEEGELLHLRIAGINVWGYFDGELGTCLAVIDRDGTKRDVFCTRQIRKPQLGQQGTTFPPLIVARDGSHVAVAVPRPETQAPGAHYHLVDRDGHSKPLAPVRDDSYITPYYPIAFADDGRRLIARLGSTLFSLPVSAISENDEANDD